MLAPDWLIELPTSQVEEALRSRFRREVNDFAGVVDTWDAINDGRDHAVFTNEERRNAITRLCTD